MARKYQVQDFNDRVIATVEASSYLLTDGYFDFTLASRKVLSISAQEVAQIKELEDSK